MADEEEAPVEGAEEGAEAPTEESFNPPFESTAIEPPQSEKKKRVQVDPNSTVQTDPGTMLTMPPSIPAEPSNYTPILYTFRVKTRGDEKRLTKLKTKPPPFYLQLDHTIAVIWTLFDPKSNKDNLGIVQLQWGLYFLQSIFNGDGVHPKDVDFCIQTIQDYLLDAYSDMSEEASMYKKSNFSDFITRDDSMPFSINYEQMINKCPDYSGPAICDSDAGLDQALIDELENIKKVIGVESINLKDSRSRDQTLCVLKDWRNEQIDKIEEAMRMLHTVEDMMKNVDERNFDGFTDGQQFVDILSDNPPTAKENK